MKIFLALVHFLSMILSFWLFRKTSKCNTKEATTRILGKELAVWSMWNIAMTALILMFVDGMPLSPAGNIFWPSVIIWQDIRLYFKYLAIEETICHKKYKKKCKC